MGERLSRGFVVTGRVQGVGFRWSARRAAERLGLVGSVRNRLDGSVEVQVAGPAHEVAQMRSWLDRGPPGARVESVREIDPDPRMPRDEFRVLV
ncbi:MAG: acylphosphatase [Gemmatimonadales bacterium]|jgi:acylphosphatase|nr:MAG: acylphosphatase [Gemmatimonadales bacterium]